MGLSARVPAVIGDHVRTIVDGALAGAGLTAAEVGSWAVHPGGPRVLTAVQDALELPATACDASRAVLADHGNMSSATIFFILERMLDQTTPAPCVALAFGPGLTVEMALFTRR
jgi:predicted naringenin-chalcone synthase